MTEPLRRVAAYAVCADHDDRVLLVRESDRSATPGVWTLPGGGVWHGEHPERAVAREAADEAALAVAVDGVLDVVADVRVLSDQQGTLHTDRIIYTAQADGQPGGPVSPKVDQARWVTRDEAAALQLRPFAANALKLPLTAVDLPPERVPDLPSFLITEHPDGRRRVQRFAAYAVVHDPNDQVLLTRIAEGYPGAGRWHLPGGGTDFGEQPDDALLRELFEETGQVGHIQRLLGVASHHEPEQVGPEGFPIDWHGVRAFYDVEVEETRHAAAIEVGGSTAEARWFSMAAAFGLPMTEVTHEALAAFHTS
ncbi:MAG TPA: NUDIX domain-containing protein [Jiangellaceae bacterium]|nr:NUDIX domain-containing protein [Jiangellaceae bacterium]